jgi:hypothetical protein
MLQIWCLNVEIDINIVNGRGRRRRRRRRRSSISTRIDASMLARARRRRYLRSFRRWNQRFGDGGKGIRVDFRERISISLSISIRAPIFSLSN